MMLWIRELLDVLTDNTDRFELLIALADTYGTHLGQPRLAIECLDKHANLTLSQESYSVGSWTFTKKLRTGGPCTGPPTACGK